MKHKIIAASVCCLAFGNIGFPNSSNYHSSVTLQSGFEQYLGTFSTGYHRITISYDGSIYMADVFLGKNDSRTGIYPLIPRDNMLYINIPYSGDFPLVLTDNGQSLYFNQEKWPRVNSQSTKSSTLDNSGAPVKVDPMIRYVGTYVSDKNEYITISQNGNSYTADIRFNNSLDGLYPLVNKDNVFYVTLNDSSEVMIPRSDEGKFIWFKGMRFYQKKR